MWIIPLCLKYYDSKLDVARRIFLGKKFICDIGEKGRNMDMECIFIIAMENGQWIFVALC
jgi:hypothetical protein